MAIIAAERARKAEKSACEAGVKGFVHETANVEQRQSYADCVDLLWPAALTGWEAIALKVAIVIVMVSAAVGVALGFKGDHDFGPVEGLFLGLLGSAVVVLLAFLAWDGVVFLLS